jgi:hypothetical protein
VLIEMLVVALTTEATITALIGTPSSRPDSTNGIFPVQAPSQPSMPYIVIEQSSGTPLAETFHEVPVLTSERWRFSAYGTTYRNAKVLGKTVRRFLISLNGTSGSVAISGIYCKNETDEAEPLERGTLFATHVDFEIVSTDSF